MSQIDWTKPIKVDEIDWSKPIPPDVAAALMPVAPEPTAAGAAQAFGRTFGRGITAGLTDYPAALAMMGTRALTGAAGPQNTYEQALADVRAGQREARQQYPVASTTGEIGGALLGAGLYPPSSIGAAVRTGSIYGGVSGFTGREGMENAGSDVAKGVALGGTLSGLGGLIGRAVSSPAEKAVATQYVANQAEIAKQYGSAAAKNLSDAGSVVAKLMKEKYGPTKAAEYLRKGNETEYLDKVRVLLEDIAPNTKNAKTILGSTSINPNELALLGQAQQNLSTYAGTMTKLENVASKTGSDLYNYVRGNLGWSAIKSGKSFTESAKEMLPAVGVGAVGGAGVGSMMGMGPVQGALLGAGVGGLTELRNLALPIAKQFGLAATARIAPTGRIPPAIGKAGTYYATDNMTSTPEEFQMQPEPVIDTRTRLQSLADQFRAKFGTQ